MTMSEGQVPEWTKGDVLRKAREAAGLSQADLAERLGWGVSTVRRLEAGTTPPKRATAMAWAMATGVSSRWLDWSLDGVEQGWSWTPDPVVDVRARRDSNPQPSDLEPRTSRCPFCGQIVNNSGHDCIGEPVRLRLIEGGRIDPPLFPQVEGKPTLPPKLMLVGA